MKRLILLRGIPGCGKSTRALELAAGDESCIFSADKFFIKDGVYQFNRENLWLAHKSCRFGSFDAMKSGKSLVIIDNTNVSSRDLKPYIREALVWDYEVLVEYPTSDWWVKTESLLRNREDNWGRLLKMADFLAVKNVHGVPREDIIRMMEKWQDIDLPVMIEAARQYLLGVPEDNDF